jgi:hypothetical protein
MLSKCLNPRCSATFRYLGQGRLFRVDFAEESRKKARAGGTMPAATAGKSRPSEYFWLCESCVATMTIELGTDGHVRAVALPMPAQVPAKKPAAAVALQAPKLVANAS